MPMGFRKCLFLINWCRFRITSSIGRNSFCWLFLYVLGVDKRMSRRQENVIEGQQEINF